MLKRRQINADQGRSAAQRAADSVLRAADAGRRAARATWWAVEEHAWEAAGPLRRLRERRVASRTAAPTQLTRVIDIVRWPFERVAWAFERRVLWPLQERSAGRVPGGAGWTVGAGALAAIGVGFVVVAALTLSDGEEPSIQATPPEPLTLAAAPAPEPTTVETTQPVLQGAAPSFDVGGAAVADPANPDAPVSSTGTGDDPSGTEAGSAAATSSAGKAVSAGPVAMKVARRFSDAFVKYEVGSNQERATSIFAETATPELATALAERPPRQPSRLEVPQARVLNLVPGPRRGKTYSVSASLLRVGTTSELRLEMRKQNGNWLVTDVRG